MMERIKAAIGYYENAWIKNLIDQSLHVLFAIIILAPALLFGGVWCAVSGFGIGFVRELTEGDGYGPGSLLDLAFWTLGGFLAGLLL